MRSRVIVSLLGALGALLAAPGAWAATLSVDDDGKDCPAAPFTSVQAAIDAAAPGDTVAICSGTYREGSGAVGSNTLTVTKDLTIKGMGADLVRIQARRTAPTGGQIAATPADLRDGVGNVIAVNGAPASPITVNLSGVTVDGNGVFVEAGVVYRDAQGRLERSMITNIVTSEAANAFEQPGGWRGDQPGYGVAQITSATTAPAGAAPRTLTIENTRVDRYNRAGVFIEGLAGAGSALVDNRGVINASEIVGRVLCQNFAANGDCSAPGLVTTGPLFGQDGVHVRSRARATVQNSIVTQNLVNGTGAPQRQTRSANGQTVTNPGTAGNENLARGAGIRLVGADAGNSLITRNNIVDNAYGVFNAEADGTTPSATAVPAPNNWWGLRFTPLPAGSPSPNPGPAISPTFNPPVPENPVNGTPVPKGAVTTSSAVDFQPYRSGPQSDPLTGQFPNIQAPTTDQSPFVELAAAPNPVQRGQLLELSAVATDDFGIRRVTFYDGSAEIVVDQVPPYRAALRIPADAPCGPRTFTALAEDSLGQTESATVTVTVTGCPGPPPQTQPVPPAVSIPNALRIIEQSGTDVPVTATSPAGVVRVEWFLGDRLVCTDTVAPFTCRIVPRITEVGLQSLRIVATDRNGLSTVVTRPVIVRHFRPRGVSIAIKKTRMANGRYRRDVRVTLRRPSGSTAAQACGSGTFVLRVHRRHRPLLNVTRAVRRDCTVRLWFTDRRSTRRIYWVSARFGGNTVLLTASSSRRFS